MFLITFWYLCIFFRINFVGVAEFFFVDTTPFVNKYLVDKDHNYDWRGVSPRATYLADLLQVTTVENIYVVLLHRFLIY